MERSLQFNQVKLIKFKDIAFAVANMIIKGQLKPTDLELIKKEIAKKLGSNNIADIEKIYSFVTMIYYIKDSRQWDFTL